MTFTCSGCGQFIKGNRVESFESLCNVCWKKSEKCVAEFLDSIESRRIGGGGGGDKSGIWDFNWSDFTNYNDPTLVNKDKLQMDDTKNTDTTAVESEYMEEEEESSVDFEVDDNSFESKEEEVGMGASCSEAGL